MNIGEIFIKLGFHADTFTLKDFSKSLGELPMKAVSSMLAIAGVSLEIASLVNKAMDAASGFQMFTAMTGLSAVELQRWQIVAKQVGMSGEAVTGSIMGINNALGQIRTGHGQAALQAFGQLHVAWRGKNPYQILNEVRKSVKGMDPQLAEQWLGGLGINPEMMRLFKMPDREFNAKAAAVPVMDESQIEAIARLKTAFVVLAEVITHSVVEPMRDLSEVLKDITPILREWIPKTYKGTKWAFQHTPLGVATGTFLSGGKNIPLAPILAAMKATKFIDDRMDDFMSLYTGPREGVKSAYAVPRIGGDLNLQQYIYSTASPEEVARHAIAEAGRGRIQASKHFGNTGS